MNHLEIFHAANEAGKIAALATVPVPMVVYDAELDGNAKPGGNRYYVADGVCGFASVRLKGNTAFGRALKNAGLARKSSVGGLYVWISDYGQSLAKKEAHAYAMTNSLRSAGIEAYAESRMD